MVHGRRLMRNPSQQSQRPQGTHTTSVNQQRPLLFLAWDVCDLAERNKIVGYFGDSRLTNVDSSRKGYVFDVGMNDFPKYKMNGQAVDPRLVGKPRVLSYPFCRCSGTQGLDKRSQKTVKSCDEHQGWVVGCLPGVADP